MTKGRFASLLVILVLALVAAGCGGDDSSSEASEETTVETTVEETTEATEDSDTSTSGDIDLGGLSGECKELATIGAKFSEAFQTTGSATGDLSATSDLFDELVDAAPDEIKDDLEVMSEGLAKYADALKGINLTQPSAEDIAKLQQVTQSFDTTEFQEASQNIEAWVTENCSTTP